MKKLYIIILYSVIALLAINLLDGFIILKRGPQITPSEYPQWAYYLVQFSIFLVYFLFARKAYQEIKNKKGIYLKLTSWCFLLTVVTYILFYILRLVSFEYFPEWDPSIVSYRSLSMEYHGPQFTPFSDLLMGPFEILYYERSNPLQAFINFLQQGLIISLLIPGLILLFKKIKS